MKLLKDLNQILKEVADVISEDETGEDEENESLDALSDEDPTTELQQLYEEVVTIIDCLLPVSIVDAHPKAGTS